MGYDLSIKTRPGKELSQDERNTLSEAFDFETNLNGPCEIWDSDAEADDLDFQMLEDGIKRGEFTRREYEAFCVEQNLDPKQSTEKSYQAARVFLDAKRGQDLFSLKLPPEEHEVREAYRLIVEFARRHNLVVNDPQVGQEIDLHNPGAYPPLWQSGRPRGEQSEHRWSFWRKLVPWLR